MTITSTSTEPGIVAVTVDYPPVNAIPSRGWFELADAITAAGNNPQTHAVILRAEGRGFNAGCGHQGDAAHRGLHRPHRREPAAASPHSAPSTSARSR